MEDLRTVEGKKKLWHEKS